MSDKEIIQRYKMALESVVLILSEYNCSTRDANKIAIAALKVGTT